MELIMFTSTCLNQSKSLNHPEPFNKEYGSNNGKYPKNDFSEDYS